MINKVYVTSVVGAPSSTAVIISNSNIEELDLNKLVKNTYLFLKEHNIIFSKIAILKHNCENIWDYKFIQLKDKNGELEYESNANCGNSTMASARVIFMLNKNMDNVIIKNIDTKLEASIKKNEDSYDVEFTSLISKSIYDFKMFEISGNIDILEDFGNINVSMIDAVNPYIIANAEDFGIDNIDELLSLNENDTEIINKVKKVRNDIIEKFKLNKNSEYPKIALVLNKEKVTARTIYLNKWHKGLPLTAIVSVVISCKIKNSNVYKKNIEICEILTPKENKKVKIEVAENGIISECKVFEIKAKGEINSYVTNNLQ